ncbi:MAG TPA: GIY-YIG nuclease family protein [Candidatus Polarisedimenticolia bacterium]|nr:GIY-YIG nuclease family protein [Candidatus Polarisedimenticolia bacterium]
MGRTTRRPREPRWSVYIVRTRDGALYTGIALDVRRRLEQHAGAARGGAKALRGRGPLRLELSRPVGSRSLAQAIEWRIKRLPRGRKLELIAAHRLKSASTRGVAPCFASIGPPSRRGRPRSYRPSH